MAAGVEQTPGGPAPQPVHEADRVREAALTVPGVVDLHGGVLGEVGTYLPGRRVVGVRLRPDRTAVHVVVAPGTAVREAAELVRTAVAGVRPGAVDVTVEDVREPEPEPRALPAGDGGGDGAPGDGARA